jgi:CO/xanthine dehydrogenase Mo-binding subunit
LDGAEGVDEMVAISPVPAIVNAINNALDLDISDIPVTPEALLRALDEQTAGCSG